MSQPDELPIGSAAEISKSLRRAAANPDDQTRLYWRRQLDLLMTEAADLIASQAARIERLEAQQAADQERIETLEATLAHVDAYLFGTGREWRNGKVVNIGPRLGHVHGVIHDQIGERSVIGGAPVVGFTSPPPAPTRRALTEDTPQADKEA